MNKKGHILKKSGKLLIVQVHILQHVELQVAPMGTFS